MAHVSYGRAKCRYCERKISASGFARASHLRAHCRRLGLISGQHAYSIYSTLDLERLLAEYLARLDKSVQEGT